MLEVQLFLHANIYTSTELKMGVSGECDLSSRLLLAKRSSRNTRNTLAGSGLTHICVVVANTASGRILER